MPKKLRSNKIMCNKKKCLRYPGPILLKDFNLKKNLWSRTKYIVHVHRIQSYLHADKLTQ